MAMEITILDGAEVLYQAFQAVSAFVKNDTWFSLIKIAEFIGVLMAAIVYIKGQDIRTFFLLVNWFCFNQCFIANA